MKSKIFNKSYTGHTQDLERRIKEHNAGKTKSIKAYIPLQLVYFERFETRTEAIKREKYFKSGSGREWIKKNV